MTDYLCDLAVIDGRVEVDVLISIEGGRFTAVAPRASDSPSAAKDAAVRLSGLTMPGFANAHSHAFHRALRSRTQADRGSFWTWRELMYTVAERLNPDNYHRLARATFAEMALAGITSVGEFHYVHHQPDGTPYADPNAMSEALFAAATESGIRITLLDTLYLHGGLTKTGYIPPEGAQIRYTDHSADRWAHRVDQLSLAANQRLGVAIHSVRAVDPDSMKRAAEWATERDAPIHAHVSEQRAENVQCIAYHGVTPTALLHEAGVLGSRFCSVHATHLNMDDIALYADTNSTVCMCPTTERDLGDGIGPTTEFVDAQIPICLGSDSHAVIDHFEECRAVELNERLRCQERGVHSAPELLAMAGDHRSIGWHDAGTISVGSRADLVTIAMDSVRTVGSTPQTAIQAAVFAASASDVTSVIVDGAVVVEGGQHRHVDVAAELRASIAQVMGE